MKPSQATLVGHRSGALLLRLWSDDPEAKDAATSPRARIYAIAEGGDMRPLGVAAGVEDILAAVRSWLEAYAAGQGGSAA
jgi:hypothetical protein